MDINEIKGLADSEVTARQKKFGFNELPSEEHKNILKIIFVFITEPMIFLLLVTIAVYFFLGDRNEALLLLLSVFGIAAIEFSQERKTEKSLETLKNLSSPISDVIRNGKRIVIPGRELVVGDIILLSEGGRIPADAKLISAENLKIDESLLTGESEPVEKHTREITNFRVNSIFSGTLVVKGHGVAEVTNIGPTTEIGKIGTSLKSIDKENSLLQKEIDKAIRVVASIAIGSSILLTLVYWLNRGNLLQGFLAGLTLAIAILPEEFPIVLTIFLTLGAWRLAKNNVLSRQSRTIETLGSTTVLCVDKTGTLTENRMEILSMTDNKGFVGKISLSEQAELIKYGVLASQKKPFDPTDEAFIEAGKKSFQDLEKIYDHNEIIKEYPLEDDSLSMVHVWGNNNVTKLVALKGAPETVFELCHLGQNEKKLLDQKVREQAKQGLRVIAIAKGKDNSSIPKSRHDFDFEFLGLVGLADPIRKEVIPAIELCKKAGIRVIMITGDYPETAAHIAKKIGLDTQNILTGAEFDELPKEKRNEVIKSISVFSRVNPSHKLTIVDTLKEIGEVVAMTGDGVNDAPALKSAHIGIAMGKKGTDVAREAANIVLLDDNFASIVRGIRLGRRIYTNLQKAMSYIVAIHIPIALLSLAPVIFGWPLALIPVHIVFLEMVIDPSCTLIFENEKEENGIMDRPPRKLSDHFFNKKMVLKSIVHGLVIALVTIAVFKLSLNLGWSQDKARGMTFLVLIIANIFLILGISGKQAIVDMIHRKNNIMLIIISITSISLILAFNIPFLRDLFHFSPLSVMESLTGIFIGASSVIGIILFKNLTRKPLN